MKEHIKDYGHYGPHSANERPRRPQKALFNSAIIKVVFEEWSLELDGTQNENLQPRRKIQSCEYDPRKTKLWHEDNTGELYLRWESLEDDVLQCSVADCYYHLPPPEGLGATVFKTSKGLLEHRRRSHGLSSEKASLVSHLQSEEGIENDRDWISTTSTDMSTWQNQILEDQEILFEVDEQFSGLGEQRSQTWEAADIPNSDNYTLFSTLLDAPLVPSVPSTTVPSTNRSESCISMSYSDGGDNSTFTSSSLTSCTSLPRRQSTETSMG